MGRALPPEAILGRLRKWTIITSVKSKEIQESFYIVPVNLNISMHASRASLKVRLSQKAAAGRHRRGQKPFDSLPLGAVRVAAGEFGGFQHGSDPILRVPSAAVQLRELARGTGPGEDVEVGLRERAVPGAQAGADRSRLLGVPVRIETEQRREVEMMRPAAHG